MNSIRFRNNLYVNREIGDLRDMVNTSALLYEDKRAYLVKDRP